MLLLTFFSKISFEIFRDKCFTQLVIVNILCFLLNSSLGFSKFTFLLSKMLALIGFTLVKER